MGLAAPVATGATELDIWPEHWAVWDVWQALENRWRVISGMAGERYQGLDMTQAESTMKLMGIKRKERTRISACLRVMENSALEVIYAPQEIPLGDGDLV